MDSRQPIAVTKLEFSIDHLRKARELARGAGAPYAALAIGRAIKSTEGARNHARGRGHVKRQPRRVTRPRRRTIETSIYRIHLTPPEALIRDIVHALDGQEHDADKLAEIVEMLATAGHSVRDVDALVNDAEKD